MHNSLSGDKPDTIFSVSIAQWLYLVYVPNICFVYFYDKGGLRTDRLSEFAFKPVWQWCLRREADVYFINIGGNDITKTSEPEAIYQRIVDLVDQLYSRPRVQLVYVGEIWLWPFLGDLFLLVQTRGDFRHGLSKEEFDRQREIINDLLRERYDWLFVEFKDVRFPKDYDKDLVHMDVIEIVEWGSSKAESDEFSAVSEIVRKGKISFKRPFLGPSNSPKENLCHCPLEISIPSFSYKLSAQHTS